MSRVFAVVLTLAVSGCILVGRETYTTLAGTGATAISPAEDVPVQRERTGHGFAQSPTAVRGATGMVVSVCDWSGGFWMLAFPPIPVPFFVSDEDIGLPDTMLVRLTFEAKGPWKARFADLALVGADGTRRTPFRYRVVLPDKAESLAGENGPLGELEPCARSTSFYPKKDVKRAKIAVLESGELLLTFDVKDLPKDKRALELDGITRNDVPVKVPPLQLDGGSRWYWYRFFP